MSIQITIEIPCFYKQTRAHGNTANDQWALSFLYITTYHEFDNTTFLKHEHMKKEVKCNNYSKPMVDIQRTNLAKIGFRCYCYSVAKYDN
jgi:hypothetical protein